MGFLYATATEVYCEPSKYRPPSHVLAGSFHEHTQVCGIISFPHQPCEISYHPHITDEKAGALQCLTFCPDNTAS